VAHTFASLPEDSKNRYRERLKNLGCREHKGTLKPRSSKGPIILSSDPAESAILPHFIQVSTLDELKALGGVPDSLFDKGKVQPPGFGLPKKSSANLKAHNLRELSSQEVQEIFNAGRAYVLGRSQDAASYREAFERLFLPLTVTAFAGENVIVTPTNPLVFSGPNPVTANFGTIIIEPGGQIIFQTQTHLSSEVIDQVGGTKTGAALDDPPSVPAVTSVGQTGSAGAAGGAGGTGSQGTPGAPGTPGKDSCDSGATQGGSGGTGTNGGNGGGGGNGGNANDAQVQVGILTNGLSVLTSGGNGGAGGNGGQGGQGGQGGPGGPANGNCGAGPQGAGGNGGPGGGGGKGGDAGNGAVIYVTYTSLVGNVDIQTPQGVGGAGGSGGPGGAAGTGSTSGGAGAPGNPGAAGAAGGKGQVIVQQA